MLCVNLSTGIYRHNRKGGSCVESGEYVDNALYMLVAGRAPSFPERERWYRRLLGARTMVWVLAMILTLFFAYDTVIFAVSGLGSAPSLWMVLDFLATIVILVVATVWMCFFPVTQRHLHRNALQTQWYDEQADRKRLEGGYTVGIYGDRVVHTDLRGATVLYYRKVASCIEADDGICLCGEKMNVLLRAQDLTEQQLLYIRELLHQRLDPSVFRIKGTPHGGLEQPLPICAFENTDTVISHGSVVLPRRGIRYRQNLRTITRGLLLPAMLIYGTSLAACISLTGSGLLDLLVFCSGMVIGGLLLVRLLSVFGRETTHCEVAFTREGLAVCCYDITDFRMWERIRVTLREKGVRLTFFDGTYLTILWKNMDNPDAVRHHFATTP